MTRRITSERGRLRACDLLLEIGTEELPSQVVPAALAQLEAVAAQRLKDARLSHGTIQVLGTPRRLALLVGGVAECQEAVTTEAMGPSQAVGFDAHGQPTRAAMGFAASQGLDVTSLVARTTPKGEYLFAVKQDAGCTAALLLPMLLTEVLGSLTFPKAMRWNDTGVRFARPIRWLLALYGGKPVRFQFAGVTAGEHTVGHRFLSSGRPVKVTDGRAYEKTLDKVGVMVNHGARRAAILSQMQQIAETHQGRIHEDDALLEQAVFSVEMPHVLIGSFNPQYLALPQTVLMTSMKEHQGYFSLLNRDGGLLPYFVAVVNMKDSQTGTIRAGNERVLAARLADARFFFDEDRKTRLDSRVEKLAGVTFHKKLGTLHEKVKRMEDLTGLLAPALMVPYDHDRMLRWRRAASLCKADLLTGMVGEFPTLQGIMGREYALHDGEPKEVADAIAEQYLPRFAEDAIPPSLAGKILSLADRLDTLAAFFAVGLLPSGSQDPFALRRHAYAVVRILVEGRLSVNVREMMNHAVRLAHDQGIVVDEQAPSALQRFLSERLRHYCQEALALRGDVVDAVLASIGKDSACDPHDLVARAKALHGCAGRPEFQALVMAFKRAENITTTHEETDVDQALFQDAAEAGLSTAMLATEQVVPGLIASRQYEATLDALSMLKAPIDAFFVGVMVMADDAAVRRNRLALLVRVRNLFRQYADFNKIIS